MIIRHFEKGDVARLSEYLANLSQESKGRFGPHPYTEQGISDFYSRHPAVKGYLAIDPVTTYIEAYAVVQPGIPDYDRQRFEAYGLDLDDARDCLFAPSVSDYWQGKGLGSQMLKFVLKDLYHAGFERVFLWGGVQAGNTRALQFYHRHQFQTLGTFEHHGDNFDMVLDVTGY